MPQLTVGIRRVGLRAVLAVAVVGALVAVAALRVPTAISDLRGSAAAETGRDIDGGALAGADSLGIDDTFVLQALQAVRPGGDFVVELPPSWPQSTPAGISPITLEAVSSFMLEVLLPAREVSTPQRGTAILCYACNTNYWSRRTHWLWSNSQQLAVGRIEH